MTPTLLILLAHPDDETGCSGTMMTALAQGWRVVLACATRGEEGEIADPKLATRENLWQVREAELRCACQILGVDEVVFLDYCDSGMDGSPSNENPKSFMQAQPAIVHQQLVQLIRRTRPEAVITFEPYGIYGHPDHIAMSRFATTAFNLAGDTSFYPEGGPPWQARQLFYFVIPTPWFAKVRDQMKALGLDTSGFDSLAQFLRPSLDTQITHILDVSTFVPQKMASLRCHQTQIGPDSGFYHLMKPEFMSLHGQEHYIQIYPMEFEPIFFVHP
ncbi:MAG TPA: PIG-L family deacetylase [Anaerolineales bacterium]|nr:PIG-L family deacetylase [Anaerolineales bacterium]